MKGIKRQIVFGSISALLFLLVAQYIHSSTSYTLLAAVLFGGVLALMVYFGLFFMIPRKREEWEIEVLETGGLSLKQVKSIMAYGRETANRFLDISKQIESAEVAEKVLQIGNTVNEIFDNFEQDPKDIRISKTFIERRLSQALRVTEDYVRLSRRTLSDENKVKVKKTEETFEKIQDGFTKHLQVCLSDDIHKMQVDNKMADYFYGDNNDEKGFTI